VAVARAQRLHGGLCLNYAAVGLVLELLDRIEVLEAALRRAGADLPQGDVPIARTTR
jgi:chaperone modulatory protein CbpM